MGFSDSRQRSHKLKGPGGEHSIRSAHQIRSNLKYDINERKLEIVNILFMIMNRTVYSVLDSLIR